MTNLPEAWALEEDDEALGEGDDCVGLALGEGDDCVGDCVVEGDDWEGDDEGACAKAEPASSAAAAVVIMNLVNIAHLHW